MNLEDKSRGVDHRSHRVAVVGSGIAGLAAARALQDHGHHIQVFDKGRSVGGRTSIHRQAPFEFDHGAQYFTVRDQRFLPHVRAWQEAGVVTAWSGRIGSLESGVWRASSPQERFVGMPGMNAIAKFLAAGLNVVTGTRIAGLLRDGPAWSLSTDNRTAIGLYDSVIVAIPAPQAAELLAGNTTLIEQAGRCTMAPCWAVLLGFDHCLPIPYDGVFVHGSLLSWVARNSSKPGRSSQEAWVLHAEPQWSAAHFDDPSDQVIATLKAEFQQAYGEHLPSPLNSFS